MTTGTARLVRSEPIEGGRVHHILLDAPKGNILSMAMCGELSAALRERQDDPGVKMVLLEGAGSHFSFGASVEEHEKDRVAAMLSAFHGLVRTVASHPVPIAALVKGQCLGGAFELVLACHLVFCTPRATMACPEVKLGVFPPVLAAVGPLRLGYATSERLLLSGGVLSAEEALRAGLATRLVEDADGVLAWYREHLAPLSAFAIRQATKVSRTAGGMLAALDGPLQAAEEQYLAELVPSHDGNEGIEAFLERRPPIWRDR
ncbi:MAG TPA: enoyl-CoA hydratase/isomerase family protein [Vulgatibacter sp.]|nr:enoyl-CoA hydratase/isomerase family protein [Vulgatibacter sp.]